MTKKFQQRMYAAQVWLDNDIITECSQFTPKDTGALIASVSSHSRIGQGLLKWVTPYARRLYYGLTFRFATDKNPKAGPMWFEKAKSINLDRWIQGVAKILGGNFG